jgi:hypothetical protein
MPGATFTFKEEHLVAGDDEICPGQVPQPEHIVRRDRRCAVTAATSAARDTISGRAATAKSAQISEATIPRARAA